MTVVYSKGFYQTCEKSDGAVLNGQDNLFTITGGRFLLLNLSVSSLLFLVVPQTAIST